MVITNFFKYEKKMIQLQKQSELFSAFLEREDSASIDVNKGLRYRGEDEQLHTDDDVVLELYYPVAQ